MKQYLVQRSGSTATMNKVSENKIPVYDDYQELLADMNNLDENQIVATKAYGDENTLADLMKKIQTLKTQLANNDVLSDFENILTDIRSANSKANAMTLDYDAILNLTLYDGIAGLLTLYANGNVIGECRSSGDDGSDSVEYTLSKDDKIWWTASSSSMIKYAFIRYYKLRDYSARS